MRMGNTESSGGLWANLPEGVYVMEIAAIEAAEPSQRFPDSPRVSIRYEVPESLRDGIPSELEDDQQQSYRVFEYAGQTLGPENKRSRLFSRLAASVGAKGTKLLDQWLAARGDIDLEWFLGMTVRVSVAHQEGQNGRVYANVTAAVPIDDPAVNVQQLLDAMRADNPDLYASVIAPLLSSARPAPAAAKPPRLAAAGAAPAAPARLPWD